MDDAARAALSTRRRPRRRPRTLDEIAANYAGDIGLSIEAMKTYLSSNISYTPDSGMLQGMELYLDLAARHHLTPERRGIVAAGLQR